MSENKLSWSTEQRKINDLLPYSKNPRKLSSSQEKSLKKSLEKFNLVEIPAIDVDNKIIAGHQRLKVMQLMDRGEEFIDVRVPNRKLTEEEFNQYLITSNAVTGEWDFEKLKDFEVSMLLDIGFDTKILNDMWNNLLEVKEKDFDVEKELAKIKVPETKLGDLIELGPHKLICGDSTDPGALKKLFGDEKASMVYSDPVYNIKINYNSGIGGKQNYGGSVNDNRTDKEYESLLKNSMRCALSVSKNDVHCFYWCDQTYIWLVQTLYREFGLKNKRVCLWLKNSQNPTPSVAFNKCYEPCCYGTKGKPQITKDINNLNEVMNKEYSTGNNLLKEIGDDSDIWLSKRLSGKNYEHATSKPPKLHEKAIRRCTKPGDIILDSFSGSGSTIIAGEQLKRKVYAVELEPIFCDLTIKRYERLTGKKANIIRTNEKI